MAAAGVESFSIQDTLEVLPSEDGKGLQTNVTDHIVYQLHALRTEIHAFNSQI